LWAHGWAFSGNPVLSLGRISGIELDLNRAVSAFGTGVDLFFVISGFCMHLMYGRSQSRFEWPQYRNFIVTRWRRIAPAFYVSIAACAFGFTIVKGVFPFKDVLAHLAFLHIVIPETGLLAAPFWSLATEWHFYLLLPLLIALGSRIGVVPMLVAAIAASIAFRLVLYAGPADTVAVWNTQLPTRLVEFLWGILVSVLHQKNRLPPKVLRGNGGFILAIGVAYLGRLLMVSEVVRAAGEWGWVLKALAEPVLTLGFGFILWNVVMTESLGRTILEHAVARALGRWSYSLYLWHWWPAYWIATGTAAHFGSTALVQNAAFILTLLVLVPVAWFSYRALELPYFRRKAAR